MTEITKKNIGKRLNEVLAQKGIMQKELAEHIEVTANTVSYYLSGERCPDIEKLVEIAKYLNVTTDYLLGISDIKSPDTELRAVCDYTGLSENSIEILREWNHRAKNPNFYFSSKTGNVSDILDVSNIVNQKYSNLLNTLNFLLCEPDQKHKRLLFESISDLFNVDFSNGNTITISGDGDIISIDKDTDRIEVRTVKGAEWCTNLNSGMLFKQYLLNQISEALQNRCEAYKKELSNGKHN